MKKNLLFTTLLTAAVAFGVTGCGTTDSGASAQPAAPAAAAVPIPADSPFAKIKPGMSMAEVYSLIGQPTDTSSHITGKSFIPYYSGGDTHRLEAIYKGQGRIVFSPRNAFTSDMQVLEINYDPKEPGYNQ